MIQLIAGLAPAIFLILYINYADKLKREPMSQLWRAFFFGVGSIAVSLTFTAILEVLGIDEEGSSGMMGAMNQAFWGAAIPEECAKLLMLWLVVRKNKYFDERMDGIVYAVCVGMGFAGLENLMYLSDSGGDWVSIGIMRALLAVPGHYYDAVFMGYFFALYWFDTNNKLRNLFLSLFAPIMAHGIYDFIVMWLSDTDSAMLMLMLFAALLWSCVHFFKMARKKISQHIESDGRDINGYNKSEY